MASQMDFNVLKNAVAKQMAHLQKHPLFRTAVEKDTVYQTYLASFPAGTNPIYRTRSEHECKHCEHFIRAVGNVVALIDGKMVSVWDIETPTEPAYQAVADALSKLVKSAKIADVFLHWTPVAGMDESVEDLVKSNVLDPVLTPLKKGEPTTRTWQHLFANLKPQFVMPEDDIPSALAKSRETAQVFLRGLSEIPMDAIDTVLELIATDSLHRGDAKKFAVETFKALKEQADPMTETQREHFAWLTAAKGDVHENVLRIRNDVIGTLLVALAKGENLDESVKEFEFKVSGGQYQRTTAVVTPAMVKKAQAEFDKLGLTSAAKRRYAVLHDISVNDILFVDRDSKPKLADNPFDDLMKKSFGSVTGRNTANVQEMPIERFLADVLPTASSVEVLFETRHTNRLVSLIAPVDPTAGKLFQWDNNFCLSYNGEVADGIKERVKNAGGSIEGDLCCRLAWDYADDLDFYMIEPGGNRISFGNRRQLSPNGGMLDLDANGCDGQKEKPAENIFYADKSRMRAGVYQLKVNNYSRRSSGVGFEVEIEFDGQTHQFAYDRAMKSGEWVNVADITYSKTEGFSIGKSLNGTQVSKNVWGIDSQQFHKVNLVMLSPNFWQSGHNVGQKHYMFMLEGCANPGSTRGFYNEFLRTELKPHRKVFEHLGGVLKVEPSAEQLSGLGFSSTLRNSVVVRTTGAVNRTTRVMI